MNFFNLIIFYFTIIYVDCAVNYESQHRLPNTTIPYHYEMDLQVILEPDFKFHGNVSINLILLKETNTIILHSDDLEIQKENSFLVDKERNKIHFFKIIGNYKTNHFLILKFGNKLKEGGYTLRLNYNGILGNFSKGLYRTEYKDERNNSRWIVSTQFEPTNARKMFPCFDEPEYKATFDLRVIHPKKVNAISNTAVTNRMHAENKTMTAFQRSPIMSTYLLALAITDFDYVESTLYNKAYRIYVDPKLINYTVYAQNITLQSIELLENTLGVDYSLNKLDQIVIQSFSGGMENWGLVVYDNSIIYKPNSTTDRRKESALNLIAHELAHQWFGNLVTTKWWSYIWLNEGFATYYGHLIANAIDPQRRIMHKHITNEIRRVMVPDSKLNEAQSLNQEVEDVRFVFSKFNSFSYTKGSAIVRLMASTFQNFDTSIRNYLRENSFSSVVPEDLFKAIGDSNELPINSTAVEILSTWTYQPGYPLISLNIDYDKGYGILAQKRFIVSENSTVNKEKWWIPITLSTEFYPNFENLKPFEWMRPDKESMKLQINDINGWTILNNQQSVYCRINYDETNWKRIIKYLNGSDYKKIHVLNRAQLLDDSLNLARAGEIPYEIALNLTTFMHQENDAVVWYSAYLSFGFLHQVLLGTPVHIKFLNYISKLSNSAQPKSLAKLKEMQIERDVVNEFSKKFQRIKSKIWKSRQKQLTKTFALLSDNIFNENDYLKVEKLFENKIKTMDDIESEMSKSTLKKIQQNIDYKIWWIKTYYDDIQKWFIDKI